MNQVYCYTDGSCLLNNQSDVMKRRGGIGVYIIHASDSPSKQPSPLTISKGYLHGMLETPVSNQTMELQAIYEAFVSLFETEKLQTMQVELYTDSKYCYSILTKWAHEWQANNWKKKNNLDIKNLNIIKKTYTMYKNIQSCTIINIHHIRAHKKAPPKESPEYQAWYGNNQADLLAQHAAKTISK